MTDTSARPSRLRTVAFRVVAAVFLLLALVGANFVLILPLVSWLSEDAIVNVLGYPADDIHHFVHGVGIGLVYGALLVGVAVQLRRPQRSVAPLWLGVFVLGAQVIYDLVQWDIGDPVWFVVYALFAAVVVLHPRRSAPIGAVDRPMLVLAGLAAVPLAYSVWHHLRLQFGPEDPFGHAASNHYYGMAALAGVIIVSALLGTTDLPGRTLVAWIAGVAMTLFAVASIAHPDHSSAVAQPWAVAGLVWAVAYVGLAWRRGSGRRAPAVSARAMT